MPKNRRRKSLRGFGSSIQEHQQGFDVAQENHADALKAFKQAIKNGDCAAASGMLVRTSYEAGIMRGEARGMRELREGTASWNSRGNKEYGSAMGAVRDMNNALDDYQKKCARGPSSSIGTKIKKYFTRG